MRLAVNTASTKPVARQTHRPGPVSSIFSSCSVTADPRRWSKALACEVVRRMAANRSQTGTRLASSGSSRASQAQRLRQNRGTAMAPMASQGRTAPPMPLPSWLDMSASPARVKERLLPTNG